MTSDNMFPGDTTRILVRDCTVGELAEEMRAELTDWLQKFMEVVPQPVESATLEAIPMRPTAYSVRYDALKLAVDFVGRVRQSADTYYISGVSDVVDVADKFEEHLKKAVDL